MSEAKPRTSKSTAATETPLRWLGYLLIVLSVFPVLSLVSYDSGDVFWIQVPRNDPPANLIGIAGALGTAVAYLLFGFGAWLLPAGMLIFSIRLAAGRNVRPWRWLGWCLLFLVACCGWLQLGDNLLAGAMDRLGIGHNPGGLAGWLLMSCFLEPLISPVGGTLVVLTLMLIALTMAIGPHAIGEGWRDLRERRRQWVMNRADQTERLELEERALARQLERDRKAAEREAGRLAREAAREAREAEREARRQAREAREQAEAEEAAERQRAYEARKEQLRLEREREAGRVEAQRAAAGQARAAAQAEQPPAPETPAARADATPAAAAADNAPDDQLPSPYQLPSVDLLAPLPAGDAVYGDVDQKADTLVKTLSEFNIPVEVTHIVKGPVVTSFELLPAPGIRVERIATMARNLEMALKATSKIQLKQYQLNIGGMYAGMRDQVIHGCRGGAE